MPKVVMLRATVVNGEARIVGEVLDVTDEDMGRLGNRAVRLEVGEKNVKVTKSAKPRAVVKASPKPKKTAKRRR